METVLPLLKQFGISPEQLGPERIKNLENVLSNTNSDNTMTQINEIRNILGMSTQGKVKRETKNWKDRVKIGRNSKCPCLSGKKYKHCCL